MSPLRPVLLLLLLLLVLIGCLFFLFYYWFLFHLVLVFFRISSNASWAVDAFTYVLFRSLLGYFETSSYYLVQVGIKLPT